MTNIKRKRLNSLPNESDGSGDSGWLDEDGTKGDGEHLLGSQEERAMGLRMLSELEGVDLSKEIDDITAGKDKAEDLVDEYSEELEEYAQDNAEFVQEMTENELRQQRSSTNLKRNYQRIRAIKESKSVVETAFERATGIAAETKDVADNEWLESGGFREMVEEQQVDPSISPDADDFEEIFGQFGMKL